MICTKAKGKARNNCSFITGHLSQESSAMESMKEVLHNGNTPDEVDSDYTSRVKKTLKSTADEIWSPSSGRTQSELSPVPAHC